jgi:hypothetical protein
MTINEQNIIRKKIIFEEIISQTHEKTHEIINDIKNEMFDKLAIKIEQRELMINIITKLSEDPNLQDWYKNNTQLIRIINSILELDNELNEQLVDQKNKLNIEIAKTFKVKENFKKYNLNQLK